MKKILSILSTISLSTIITTNIIACQQPNTNNKPNKQNKPELIPQQPPEKSNGKLITDIEEEKNKQLGTKGYIEIIKRYSGTNYEILNNEGIHGTYTNLKAIYRGDGNGKPQIPTINKDTGEITDGNEKIES